MKCDNTLTFATIKGNFISNNDANTDLKFQISSNDFITLSTANDVIEVDKEIELHSSVLKSDVLDTWSNSSLEIRRNGINYLSLEADDTISISRQSKISSNKADGVDMTVSHFNNTTNLFEKKLTFKNGNEIHATGDGGADEELLLNYYTDAGVRIGNATDAYLTIKGARNGTHTLTVNGDTYFGGAVNYNGDIVLTNPYKLKTNEISSNGVLQDIVFKIDGITTEFFRCQASDFTVRLPNDRSFLSQNIFTDIIKPLTFSTDVVLNGGNSTNDAYEEYIKLEASTDKVVVSKIIDTSEDIIMTPNKKLYLDDTVNKNRYIRSSFRSGTPSFEQLDIVNETAGGRIRLILDSNGSTTTDEQFIVENTGITCRRILKAGQGLDTNTIDTNTDVNLTFSRNGSEFLRLDKTNDNITCSKEIVAGGGIKNNTFDSDGVSDIIFKRDDIQYFVLNRFIEVVNDEDVVRETITFNKQIRANGNILVNNLQINQFSVGVQYTDFRLHNADSVMRFYVGNSSSVNLQITNNDIHLNRATTISSVKTNLINSNGDNTVNLQQNGNTFIALQGSTLNRVQVNRLLRVVDGGGSTQCQFVESTNGNYTEFRLGNHINAYTSGGANGNYLHLNYYSHGNVMLGTDQDTSPDPKPTISINKFSSDTGNAFEVQGDSLFYGDISTNASDNYVYTDNIRHNTGTNLNIWTLSTTKFYSNAINKMEIKQTQIDINEDVVFASGKGLTVPEIFTYNYDTNGALGDVIWAYNNNAYMFYDQSEGKFAFMVDVISNFEFSGTAFNVVSDERMKENIEDVDEDCSEIVKNIEVKTFNYKDDKKKKKNIGYIAQDVKKKVPSKFEAVVSDSGEFMGLDYGKMSAILWKCCQEQQSKIEYLESKLLETIARVEALEKPKRRTTTKTEK